MEPKATLLGPVQIRELAQELDVSPTKKLGQNFVHDTGTVRKIAALAGLDANSAVLEIGPGLGSLTLALLETGARVQAVEIDPRLAGRIGRTVDEFEPQWSPRFQVLLSDALELAPSTLDIEPTALVANLPYNVSVPVLLHVLALYPSIRRVVVMVQREVAERLAAAPGSRVYGAPSVKLGWYGPARLAGVVGRKVFWPEPNVDSALVSVDVTYPEGHDEGLRSATFQVVDAAFGQRRKMLRKSLAALMGEGQVGSILSAAGVEPTERPESLTIGQFVAIASAWRSAETGSVETGSAETGERAE